MQEHSLKPVQSQLPNVPHKSKASHSPWLLPLILIIWPFILGPIATLLLFNLQPSSSPQALVVFVGPVSVLIGVILLLFRKPWKKNAEN